MFENQTVAQNLELALAGTRAVRDALRWFASDGDRARIAELLEITRLDPVRDRLGRELSHGQKQWLEIGMLLMQDPELLMLDEPATGLTHSEVAELSVGQPVVMAMRKRYEDKNRGFHGYFWKAIPQTAQA